MSFFKNKEEVINIELTSYGKQLLSKGLFDPKYYTFHDDEIIYDSQCAGFFETQNDCNTRILEQTPYLKPIIKFSGSTTEISQNSQDYSNFLGFPLSTTDSSEQKFPAINIKFFDSTIASVSGASNYFYDKNGPDQIPQINLNTKKVTITIGKNYTNQNFPQEENIVFGPNEDDSYVSISTEKILLDIFEENVDYLTKNFEVEVYKIEKENVQRLKFQPIKNEFDLPIVDGMLGGSFSSVESEGIISDPNLVEDSYKEENNQLVNSYFYIQTDESVQQDFKTNRLYIYDDLTEIKITPKGDLC